MRVGPAPGSFGKWLLAKAMPRVYQAPRTGRAGSPPLSARMFASAARAGDPNVRIPFDFAEGQYGDA